MDTKAMGRMRDQMIRDEVQHIQLGHVIEGYCLERELGRSPHGVSFYARRVMRGPMTWNDVMAPEIATFKLLWTPIGSQDDRALEPFRDRFALQAAELQAVCGILIPSALKAGAAQIITWGGAPDQPYMIRSCIVGYSLAARLANQRQGLPPVEVVTYITRAAAALDYAHARGITHGALTLENILVSQHGDLLVSDFGIERLLYPLSGLPFPPPALHLARYFAPERFGAGHVTPDMDTYSLGVALYALVCGHFPFDGGTVEELRHAQRSASLLSPRRFRRDLPPEVESVMLKALSRASKDRFATAGALAEALTCAAENASG